MTVKPSEVLDALKQHGNVLLYGPPGTGKSHLMKAVGSLFEAHMGEGADLVAIDTDEERTPFSLQPATCVATRWVTFHQGYSYEDFVVGMRPIAAEGIGFSIQPRAGVLLEVAAEALQGGIGLLLIDEINRGNTSRIFGEFITLMDRDKRLDDEGNATPTTVPITLPYLSTSEEMEIETSRGIERIGRNFSMPANVFTLASMNSVDKSISPMDTALRRRFHVINLAPTVESIQEAVGLPGDFGWPEDLTAVLPGDTLSFSSQDIAILAASLLTKLNRSIGFYLGSDFMLGQWYLPMLAKMDNASARAALSDCWLYRVLPQLMELFHGRNEQLITVLGLTQLNSVEGGIVLFEPDDSQREFGATSYLETVSPPPAHDQILRYLAGLVVL